MAANLHDLTGHSPETRKALSDRVREIAPGFYIERDSGDWYCVAANFGGRVGEDFAKPTDALRFLLWLAGDPLPKGWTITNRNRLSADIDCGQGYRSCLWVRPVNALFPGRLDEIVQ